MKILFILPYSSEGPSNRYRVEQYFPYLRKRGIQYSARPFISSDFFKIRYQKGKIVKKIFFFLVASLKRLQDVISINQYDVIFIHIEAFPFGPAVIEWLLKKFKKSIVYDFEDAIYLKNFKGDNPLLNWLRCSWKFYDIVGLSSQVIVCNRFMKEKLTNYNKNIMVLPTSIDTEKFYVRDYSMNNATSIPIIGWVGSYSTVYCLESLRDIFIELAKKHIFFMKVVGAGSDFNIPGVRVINVPWSMSKDVSNFRSLDIGVYPLPYDERAIAKTPFKTIQYMSVGVPVVASRVGGNMDIIKDGKNGFLASTNDEWVKKLSILLENSELRRNIGLEGHKTVEERFSVKQNADLFMGVIQKACSGV